MRCFSFAAFSFLFHISVISCDWFSSCTDYGTVSCDGSETNSQLPSNYYGDLETEGVPRTVADYIAGMTDSYILDQYGALVTKL